jgi:pSer/pThr/pTyr-binding forkhead associated (FHA) protein
MDGFVLEVVEGPSAGLRLPVEGVIELGRASRHGRLTDEQVSRHHAKVEPGDGGVTVTDLGSTNGTHVNGRPIAGPRHVRPNGDIRLGLTVLRLRTLADVTDSAVSVPPSPTLPQIVPGLLQPADAEELADDEIEARLEELLHAQELLATVVPARAPQDAADMTRGPLSRIADAQVSHQARVAAVVLLGSSALAVILYVLLS